MLARNPRRYNHANLRPAFGQALELCADCAPCDWPFHRRKRDRDRYVDIRPNSRPF